MGDTHQCPSYALVGAFRYPCLHHEGGQHHYLARWPACLAPWCRLEPGHQGPHDIPAGSAVVMGDG